MTRFQGILLGIVLAAVSLSGCRTTLRPVEFSCGLGDFDQLNIPEIEDACWLAAKVIESAQSCTIDEGLRARLMPDTEIPCLGRKGVASVNVEPVVPVTFFVDLILPENYGWTVPCYYENGVWMVGNPVGLGPPGPVLD